MNTPKSQKTKEKQTTFDDKVNSWFCPINPITQALEYFYGVRKKNG